MRKTISLTVSCLLLISFFPACTPTTRYEKMLNRELASGIRHDSLFLGLYLGMPRKDFYMHCWELNRQGLVKQGSNNTTVEYYIKNELKHPVYMDFYPTFIDDSIAEMPVRFAYAGWAPWNKELSSAKLQLDVLNWYRKLYGPGFIKVKHPEKGTAYLKVDGNRRILIFTRDDLYVWALFTNMLAVKDSSDFNIDFQNKRDTLTNNPALK
ncbi:MAG: hypothetical protein HPY62_01335 [Bacteroidales bacterium]|nr:hypothetical protein [Bacteroidales bacterium]